MCAELRFHGYRVLKSGWLATLAVLLVMNARFTVPAQAEDSLKGLVANGAVIAIAPEPPWMALDTDGKPIGMGPEIDSAVLNLMGVTKISGQVMEYGAIIPSLQARRVTLGSSGALNIKPERCKSVNFSEPVLCSGEGFVLPVSLIGKVKSYKDVADQGLRIGVCGGCTEQKLAVAAGVPDDKIIVFPDGTSGFKLLIDNRIDVFAHDSTSVADLQKRLGDSKVTQVVRVADTQLQCAAAAFNLEDAPLRDAYNDALKQVIASGKYMEVLNKYGHEEVAIGRDSVTTAQLCGE